MPRPHKCKIEAIIYEHGTHFVFPESMLKMMLPVGSIMLIKIAFQSERQYLKRSRKARWIQINM